MVGGRSRASAYKSTAVAPSRRRRGAAKERVECRSIEIAICDITKVRK
jgi:hypothetical protein